jgi:pSer/pThr/pTyr-binding forkhead associated (FHA) protein
VRSFLISSLVFRYGSADSAVFERAHPHDWLLWESGAWKAPAATTLQIGDRPPTPPPLRNNGEALALALEFRPNADQLTLGRGAECDASINDGTLSQLHLLFMRRPSGVCTVRDANSLNGSSVDGVKLEVGKPIELSSGSRIHAAQVQFTYYSPAGMLKRLKT